MSFPKEETGLEIPLPANLTMQIAYILNSGKQLFTAISNKFNIAGGYIANATKFLANSTGNIIYSACNVTSTAVNETVVFVYTTVETTGKQIVSISKSILMTVGLGLIAYGSNEIIEGNSGKKRNMIDMVAGGALAGAGSFLVVQNLKCKCI